MLHQQQETFPKPVTLSRRQRGVFEDSENVVDGCVAVVVLRCDDGAAGQQRLAHSRVALLRRDVQQRVAVAHAAGDNVFLAPQQINEALDVVVEDGTERGRNSRFGLNVARSWIGVDEVGKDVQITKTSGEMHSCEAIGILLDDRGLGSSEQLAAQDAAAGYSKYERCVALAVAQVGVGLGLQQRLNHL